MCGRVIHLLCACLILVTFASSSQQLETEIENPLVLRLGIAGEPYEALRTGRHGGIIRRAVPSDPTGWNPVVTVEAATRNVCYLFLRPLVGTYETTGGMYGELARLWEVSEDGLQVTFYLRRGLVWSDGVPFTADDVLFTYNDLHLNEDVNSSLRGQLRLPGGGFPLIEKLDDFTIRVTSPEAFRPLLGCFGAHIMPRHKLAQYVHRLNPNVPAGTFNETWRVDTPVEDIVGLGPFLLDSYVQGQQIAFRSNPYYYHFDQSGNRLPYVDGVIYAINESLDSSLLQFLNGQIDAVGLRGQDIPLLMPKEAEQGFTVYASSGGWSTRLVALNQDCEDKQLRTLFRQLEFRKAVAHAIDRQTIIDLVWLGQAIPIWSPVSMRSPYYAGREEYAGPITERDAVLYDFDLAWAGSLLDGCGILDRDGDGVREFPDGKAVEFTLTWNSETSSRAETALIIAADLERIGIRVILDAVAWPAYVTNLLSGTYEAALLGFSGGEDPNGGKQAYATTGREHLWHFTAASGDAYPYEVRIDQLFDLGAGTYDIEQAFAHYREFQILFAEEDLGAVFTVSPGSAFAVYDWFGNAEIFSVSGEYSGAGVFEVLYVREPSKYGVLSAQRSRERQH